MQVTYNNWLENKISSSQLGGFTVKLFIAYKHADSKNKKILGKAFPFYFLKKSEKYQLGENCIIDLNGDKHNINVNIFNEEIFEYRIEDRENIIHNLYNWIAEANGSSKTMMMNDLDLLKSMDDEYIFSSIRTNEYVSSTSDEFDDICQRLINKNNIMTA